MKILPIEFTKKGFTHKQIERTGNIAIYERTKPHYSRSHFEVIKIRVSPAHERFGQRFEDSEVYPSSEQWGQFGFTCIDLTEARARAATMDGGQLVKPHTYKEWVYSP